MLCLSSRFVHFLRVTLRSSLPLLALLGILQPSPRAQSVAPKVDAKPEAAGTAPTQADPAAKTDLNQEAQQDQGQKSKKRKVLEGIIVAPIPITFSNHEPVLECLCAVYEWTDSTALPRSVLF